MGKKGTFSLISSVSVGPTGEIFVADTRVQMFSAKGDFMEVIYDEGRGMQTKISYFDIVFLNDVIKKKIT